MAQYIDKDAVVAEIRGKINSAEAYLKYHPDECKGPGHRYYFNYDMPNRDIKFID